LCAIKYPTEPGIDPDLWLEFLDRIFAGNKHLIEFVQRLLGMALVGEVFEHLLPIFFGVGANGKSVWLETVCGMLGPDYAMNAPTSLLMATKSDRHCVAWQRGGLQAPEEVSSATSEYRDDMDTLGEFLKDCCVAESGLEVRASDLYHRYRRWAEGRGEYVETQTKFGGRLGERGFAKGRDAGNRVTYRGIGLLAEGPDSSEGFSV
jgi:phage/plasmid-associated DNA primase